MNFNVVKLRAKGQQLVQRILHASLRLGRRFLGSALGGGGLPHYYGHAGLRHAETGGGRLGQRLEDSGLLSIARVNSVSTQRVRAPFFHTPATLAELFR